MCCIILYSVDLIQIGPLRCFTIIGFLAPEAGFDPSQAEMMPRGSRMVSRPCYRESEMIDQSARRYTFSPSCCVWVSEPRRRNANVEYPKRTPPRVAVEWLMLIPWLEQSAGWIFGRSAAVEATKKNGSTSFNPSDSGLGLTYCFYCWLTRPWCRKG